MTQPTYVRPAYEDENLIERRDHEAKRLKHMCVAYSDVHGIKGLPREEVYKKSLRIPPEGVMEKIFLSTPSLNGDREWAHHYPVIRGGALTAEAEKHLGTYAVRGNVIKFVDRNGDTWVSPCLSVLTVLEEKGFKRVEDSGIPFMIGRPTGIFAGVDYGHRWDDLLAEGRKELKPPRYYAPATAHAAAP